MKRICLALALYLSFLPVHGQNLEPGLPDIPFPDSFFELKLPEAPDVEQDILISDTHVSEAGELVLPDLGEFAIPEPQHPVEIPGSDITFPPVKRDTPLVTESVLGAGTRNHIASSIYLIKPGEKPTLELQFLHEGLDGFGSHPPGSAYYTRTDQLNGGFTLGREKLELSGFASYEEDEMGLQGQSLYNARLYRTVQAQMGTLYQGEEMLRLQIDPLVRLTTLLWKGSEPEKFTEVLGSADVTGELVFEKLRLGVFGSYGYRTLIDAPLDDWNYTLHRFESNVFMGLELPLDLHLEAKGGWFFNSDTSHLFPFTLTLSGIPFGSLAFSLSGGYRIRRIDLNDLFGSFPFLVPPVDLSDDHGWYGEIDGRLIFREGTFLRARLNVGWNNSLTYPGEIVETDGFYGLNQVKAVTLEPEIELGWRITSRFSINFDWQGCLYDVDTLIPLHRFYLSTSWSSSNSDLLPIYGGEINLALLSGPYRDFQLPELGLSGYYRFSESIKLVLSVDDLLSPLLDSQIRYLWQPYEAPGIRLTAKVHIHL